MMRAALLNSGTVGVGEADEVKPEDADGLDESER
jgi:hypothetical protein